MLKISPDKLYVSIYKGGIAPRDAEAYEAWKKYVPAERIFELGEADNTAVVEELPREEMQAAI